MGGEVNPGQQANIRYYLEIGGHIFFPNQTDPARKQNISWTLADGYLPSPISTWTATAGDVDVSVQIQHFAFGVDALASTLVFSRVTLSNAGTACVDVRLHVTASASFHTPLNAMPESSTSDEMVFPMAIAPGAAGNVDFSSVASGSAPGGTVAGGFDENYASFKTSYANRASALAEPVTLTNPEHVLLFKSAQATVWESLVTLSDPDDYQIRASGGNPAGLGSYDGTYSHDLPNIVDELVREGDYALALQVMDSPTYLSVGSGVEGNGYLDAVPKFILPFARYVLMTGNTSVMTDARWQAVMNAAHLTSSLRNPIDGSSVSGLMGPSSTLDNNPATEILVDDFAALHGLMAYQFLAAQLGDTGEQSWVSGELSSLNDSLNQNLQQDAASQAGNGYMVCLTNVCPWTQSGYDGNWIATSLMMSDFPWGGSLFNTGPSLGGGFWDQNFDTAVAAALAAKSLNPGIPLDSWGAWDSALYGATYNAGMGLQLLYSERYRIMPLANVDWLLANASAPMQWGESFSRGDWSNPAADYESWGLSFMKKTILESHVASKANGDVVLGRGIAPGVFPVGQTIEWANVPVVGGSRLSFSAVRSTGQLEVTWTGAPANGQLVINYPIMVGNICGTSVGTVDSPNGIVYAPPASNDVKIHLCQDAAPSSACSGIADGMYCGGDGVSGDSATLYSCTAGTVIATTPCENGCAANGGGGDNCN